MKFAVFCLAALATTFGVFAVASSGHPVDLFQSGDPLMVCIWMATGFALASFVAGWVSGDYSWIDRLWSTPPSVF